jgi:dihydropteroate synthase
VTAQGAWRIRGGVIDLAKPRFVGILNITPNSFSDGGEYLDPGAAFDRAHDLVESGADLIDIGGESTRPGSERVDASEQIRRVVPVIRAIRDNGLETPISIDTTLADVAEAALDAGASIINDIAAGTESAGVLDLAARTGAGLILMHRLLAPDAPAGRSVYPTQPDYAGGVVGSVRAYLHDRANAAVDAGVDPASIVVDPGLGFGKSVDQNYQLIAGTGEILALGYPVLSAASRKSFIGAVTGVEHAADRIAGSVAISVAHFNMGVRLFRVHDVGEHRQALAVAAAIEAGNRNPMIGVP